jgi:protein TonB
MSLPTPQNVGTTRSDADPLLAGSRALLIGAFALSLALHALTLFLPDPWRSSRAAVKVDTVFITAWLEPRAAEPPAKPPEVLKNTLDQVPPEKAAPQPPRPPRDDASRRKGFTEQKRAIARAERLPERQLDETLGRLSQTLLYPPEALAKGIQGEVVLLLELGDGGRIVGASVAASSGHAVLDDAALRAAGLMGTLSPTLAGKAILLPVRFRIL